MLAIREYFRQTSGELNYMSAVSVGVMTSLVEIVPFSIFQLIHLAVNTEFMRYLQENIPYVGQYPTPFTSALTMLFHLA